MKKKTKMIYSTWPRGAIDGQMSLDWPRSAIAFLLNPRGLQVSDGQLSLTWPRSVILAFSFANFPRGLALP